MTHVLPLNFSVDGSVNGTGSFSRWKNIGGLVGIEAMETTSSAKTGDLSYDDRIRLIGREGPVVVVVHLESINLTNETDEEENPVLILKESGFLQVDEAWPAGIAEYKKISYAGPSIKTMERYMNNGDTVATFIDSRELSKESLYRGSTNRSLWFVNLTRDGYYVNRATNKTSYYALDMSSNGSLTSLDVIRRDENSGGTLSQISQDFVGQIAMRLIVNMNEKIIYNSEREDWLNCCFDGLLNMSAQDLRYSSADEIFDCTCNRYTLDQVPGASYSSNVRTSPSVSY